MAAAQTIPANAQKTVVTFTLKVDGDPVPETYQVQSVSVRTELNRVPSAKLLLLDGNAAKQDFPVSNEQFLIPGKTLEIFVGYRSEEDLIFSGVIVKHGLAVRRSGSPVLKLECKDEAMKMTVGPKSRYFSDVTDKEVIEEILGDYDFDTEIEEDGVTHKELVQYDATDWDFLISRVDMNGMLCLVENGAFTIQKPKFDQEPALGVEFGKTILEFDAEMDARTQYPPISMAWDYVNQELQEVEAQDPAVQENGNLTSDDLEGVVDLSAYELRHSGQLSQEELQIWANSRYQRSKLSKIRGRVKFSGFAQIKPGQLLTIGGVGDRFNGDVFVSGVRHEVVRGYWTTDVQFGLSPDFFTKRYDVNHAPASGLLPAIRGLHIGVVVQLHDDPDGEHRVLVRLPVISQAEEGTWARVATLDAGNNRGAFFRPEVGDEVIVGFINNDPRNAVVLGGLFSSAKAPPYTAEAANPEKGFVSREGLELKFDDGVKNILIRTPEENMLLLSEEDGGLTLADQNGNSIVMDSSGITIESSSGSINIKAGGDVKSEAVNIEHNAQAQLKAAGMGGLEVSSSGTAIIKGTLVKIN